MEWDKLKTFYYVAKNLSITNAAKEINITQSALSRQILLLESQLKFKLFERHAFGLSLTKEGQMLYKTVKKIIDDLDSTMNNIKGTPSELDGPLKIYTTVSLANSWFAGNYWGEFTSRFPNINLTLVGNDSVPPPDTTQASVSLSPYISNRDDLIQEHLMAWHLKLYAHSSYLRNFGIPKNADDLVHHRILTYGSEGSHPYNNINWVLNLTSQPLKPWSSINSAQGLLAAIEAGLGIASFSEEFTALNGSPRLIPVLPHLSGPTVDIFYVYPKKFKTFKRIIVFREFLREVVQREHKPRLGILSNDYAIKKEETPKEEETPISE